MDARSITHWAGNVVSAVLVDRALTVDEKARLHVFGVGKGGWDRSLGWRRYSICVSWGHLVGFPAD